MSTILLGLLVVLGVYAAGCVIFASLLLLNRPAWPIPGYRFFTLYASLMWPLWVFQYVRSEVMR